MLESERLILVNYNDDNISFFENFLSNPNMEGYIGNGEIRNGG